MRQRLPERELARLVVLQACADALMPALHERAAEERAAGNEALARSLETSGAQGNMAKVSATRYNCRFITLPCIIGDNSTMLKCAGSGPDCNAACA